MNVKVPEEEPSSGEKNLSSRTQESPSCRPTPLYGQPSWWGEEDVGSKVQSACEPVPDLQNQVFCVDPNFSGSLHDVQPKAVFSTYNPQPNYFEIPTKDLQHSRSLEEELQEIPTKDTDKSTAPPSPPTPTPPIVQSHASFTIEFDDCSPGKIKIKDHVTKFSTRQRVHQNPPHRTAVKTTPVDVMSSESKVADWLVHTDVSMMRRRPVCEDVFSTKSDLAINIRTLKGHRHDDGTQSDSEDPSLKGRTQSRYSVRSEHSETTQQIVQSDVSFHSQQFSPTRAEPPASLGQGQHLSHSPPLEGPSQGPSEHLTQQAFVIEFFDDNPRKKRSQSFTHNTHSDTYSALKAKLERRKVGERPASVHGHVSLKSRSGPQRSSSLKREKTEGEAASTSVPPQSSPGIIIRPFGSVGKKSKLAQEFVAELLKQPTHAEGELSPVPMSAPPVMVTPHARIPSPQEAPALSSVAPSACPLQPPVVSQLCIYTGPGQTVAAPTVPPLQNALRSVDTKGVQRALRTEEEDSLSDAGTYTIETESQDQEVEEARHMIDQVFGVLESAELSGVDKPVVEGQEDSTNLPPDVGAVDPLHGFVPADVPSAPTQAAAALEEPKWVSCWASLAGGYAEPGSNPPGTASPEDTCFVRSTGSCSYDCSESESSFSCRTRRLLPQVPPEKSSSATPGILIYCEPHKDLDHTDTVVAPPSAQGLSVHDDVDPDSLSDASRSDDAPVLERTKSSNAPGALSPDFRDQDKLRPLTKSTFFYIGSEDSSDKPDQICSIHQSEKSHDPLVKPPATTVLIRHLSGPDPRRSGVKPNSSAPDLHTQNKDSILTKDNGASCFVRQESFTRDRPSDGIQLKKLPHISSHPSLRDLEQRKNTIQDTQCSPQETEGTLFSLDNRFPTSDSGRSSKRGGSSSHVEDSLSGESDVDTASTVSHVSSKNAMTGSTPKKHRVISGLKKEKSSSSPSIQEKGRQLSARERLSEKRRSQNNGEPSKKVDAAKSLQMRRSTGTCGSLDLSEGQQGSGPNWCENVSSDQETSHPPGRSKKLQKDTNRKMPKTPTQQVLTRSNSLSAPRPTRASMLRRARLGEASDNEGAETDRGSQNSDNITTSSKVATEGKKLSRLDILAMPRKRTGSFTAPSDSEVTGRVSVFTRNASRASARKASEGEVQPANSRGLGAPKKQHPTKSRSSGAKYQNPGSRRRQKDSEYSSSSEEEYPVHKDSSQFISSAHTSQAHWTSTRSTSSKSPPLEMEDNDEQNQVDAYQNWSTHTAEIAKLSQDLAKDLAILAREIHDVAGDGDSMSACTPASTISTREELVQQIPELGLNFQKVPPGPGPPEGDPPFSERDANMNPPESGSEQRRTWNREEVILDNLMLNPVWQLSQDIRQNTEQLAQNMKVLFQNKVQVWEQTEARINAENDIPILKTSNKEISSIIKELRRVQRQLRVINTMVETDGNLDRGAVVTSPPTSQTLSSSRDKRPAPRSCIGPSPSNVNERTRRLPGGPHTGHYKA